MSDTRGWEPLRPPRRPVTPEAFVASPFTRLARVHALVVAGDTLVAIALAGSLFFDIDPQAARWRVLLYLLLTVAPFALVAPLIGPAIDRMAGGRRLMVVLSALGRAVACTAMVWHLDSLVLFPLAFVVLVLGKGYHVSKSALVPTTVSDDTELVEANAKLGLLGGLVGFVAAIPGLLASLIGPEVVVGLAAVVFAAGTVAGLLLPRTSVATTPVDAEERAELRSGGIILAASAMALLRATVGFLTFLIAFSFRRTGTAPWWFGVVLAASALGTLAGSALAPATRRSVREETMLTAVLAGTSVMAVVAVLLGGRLAAALLAGAVGLAASVGKLAFDSILQRDAPEANRGRSIAAFETRFQLAWVCAAVVPVLVPGGIPDWWGYLVVAGLSAFAAVSYLVGQRSLRERGVVPPPLRHRARAELQRRRAERAGMSPSVDPPPPPAGPVSPP